jgi:hypothetical protein
MDEQREPPGTALEAALSDLKVAAAHRRRMHRGSPEYRAAIAAEIELSNTVYDLIRALHKRQSD